MTGLTHTQDAAAWLGAGRSVAPGCSQNAGDQRQALEEERKRKKKSRRRKLVYWLLIDLVVAATVIGLLLYKPARYHPAKPMAADPNVQSVHPYLHRDLASRFYNNAQSQKPFAMTVLDKSLNEAIAQYRWPQESGGITFTAPQVIFATGRLVLMGTATVEGADFVVTIELAPRVDEQGLLHIRVEKVKVGAMNVTPLARMIAERTYQERLEELPSGSEDIRLKIAGALLADTPFDPVFRVEDKWVRLKNVDITSGQLIGQFVPAPKPSASD
jgi:hypothetical protein